MMRDDSTTASADKQNWFEYAYYSSPVNFEDGSSTPAAVKPLKLQ